MGVENFTEYGTMLKISLSTELWVFDMKISKLLLPL